MNRQSMEELHKSYYKRAETRMREVADPIIEVVRLQLELMLEIVKKRHLQDMPVLDMMKNMIIAMFDEINEANDWYQEMYRKDWETDKSLIIEARYEIVDLYHFYLQLLILGYIREQKWSLKDLMLDNEKQKLVVRAVSDSIKQFLKHEASLHTFSIQELLNTLYMETSKLLNVLPWKHWKTYTQELGYYALEQAAEHMHAVMLELFKRFGGRGYYDLVAHYIVKNYENLDRQARGY